MLLPLPLSQRLPRPELKNLAEDIKQRMLRETIVPLVDIEGFSTRQFKIQVSQHNLRQYGLSLQDIANLVTKQNIDLPAGDITTQDRDYQIRFSGEKRSIEELKQLMVIEGGQRNEVRLADIATITDGFDNQEDKVTFNGKPAAFLKVSKNTRDDSLKILAAVEQFIADQEKRLPEQVEFHLTQDFTSIIDDRIEMLSTNAWQGLILVFCSDVAVLWYPLCVLGGHGPSGFVPCWCILARQYRRQHQHAVDGRLAVSTRHPDG